MTDNMQKFMQLASENEDVQKQLQSIADSAADELATGIIALAEAHGIAITASDLSTETEDLSDDELDEVAGGGVTCFIIGFGLHNTFDAATCTAIGVGFEVGGAH